MEFGFGRQPFVPSSSSYHGGKEEMWFDEKAMANSYLSEIHGYVRVVYDERIQEKHKFKSFKSQTRKIEEYLKKEYGASFDEIENIPKDSPLYPIAERLGRLDTIQRNEDLCLVSVLHPLNLARDIERFKEMEALVYATSKKEGLSLDNVSPEVVALMQTYLGDNTPLVR